MLTVSFLAQLVWNSLSIERFPLTYDLSGCKSRINRNLIYEKLQLQVKYRLLLYSFTSFTVVL